MFERDYAYTTQAEGSVEEVALKVREALAEQGFGVLTEIDVQATLKAKLDVDRTPYLILGACAPPFAHKAISAEPPIGVLLPCNVTVFEDDDGKTWVQSINPEQMFGLIQNTDVQPIAAEVGDKLRKVLDAVSA